MIPIASILSGAARMFAASLFSGGAATVKIHGLDELKDRFDELSGEELDETMEAAAEEVLAGLLEASQEIVPYETGNLHDSGFYEVERDGKGIKGTIGYEADYAMEVHEDPERQHDPGTQWKFLEAPLMERQNEYLKTIGSRIRDHLTKRPPVGPSLK